MLRNKPKLSYCGLTIILSNPSRFDTISLLSANGGSFLFEDCLGINKARCDIRLKEDETPLFQNTKAILILGETALHRLLPQTRNNSIHEYRGSFIHNGFCSIPTVASYLPQDACDYKNYEAKFNQDAEDYSGDGEYDTGEDEEGSETDLKGMGKTKRANYGFWLKEDCKKIVKILNGKIPKIIKPKFIICPEQKEIVEVLSSYKGTDLLFDMETDYEDQNMLCFSVSFDGYNVYCVPVITPDYGWYYSNTGQIMAALQRAIYNNTIVAHNGANFDFLVLAMKYRIPIKRAYDTMIAHQRCWPAVEKSLGHAVSHLTWEKFHKDMDSESYRNETDMISKLRYCGTDVFTMGLVKREIDKFVSTIPGLSNSIAEGNRAIRSYLTCMMQGIKFDDVIRQNQISHNDRLMMQFNRMTEILIGESGLREVRNFLKGNPNRASFFAGSNKQCVVYFHKILGYPVQFTSPKTGEASLGKKSLFKLALRYPDNPVIRFVILYRLLKKETSTLQFNPWRDDNNKILPRIKEL
jgi:hypothetical protein